MAWRLTANLVDQDLRALAETEQVAIAEVFGRDGPKRAGDLIAEEVAANPNQIVLLADADGRPQAGNLDIWPPGLAAQRRWEQVVIARPDRPDETFGVTTRVLGDGHRLLVGYGLAEKQRLSQTLRRAMGAALAAALALALAGAWLLGRYIGGRVRTAAHVAAEVTAGDLSRRIPDSGAGDAFDTLAASLNVMLERIETLLGELRLVTDSLAHDLRSPLTRMRAAIDRALADPDLQRARDALALSADEADAMLRMLEIGLQISRAEAGFGRDMFVPVDIAAILRDLAEMYGPLAEDQGVAICTDTSGPLLVSAQRDLLVQSLANLVENALRYAGPMPAITLSALRVAGWVEVRVADSGAGIPAEARGTALRRFGRVDAARSSAGAGLGLPLAAAITRMHGGTLTLLDGNPGLVVLIRLPSPEI